MKTIRPIIALFVAGAIGFGLYYYFFPPTEKVIRSCLSKLGRALSARPQGNISTVANVNRIASFFHPNVSVTVEGFGGDFGSIQGRGELQQTALAARQRVGSISVQFYNIQVLPSADKTNASATATALVKIGDETNPIVQDIAFQFEKAGREWLIRSAVPQKSLKIE